jgi:iron complex transport system substrate-binding protein
MRRAPTLLAPTLLARAARLALGLVAVGLVAAGCGGSTNSGGSTGSGTASAATSNEAATYPVTAGKLTLAQRPAKIVSLSPTATEMLFAVGAGSQVTAVDNNSNYPAEAPKTDLSGYQPNAEAIAAKNPDLVIISDDANKISEALGKLKIPVYQAPAAATLDDTYQQIADIGALTGHPHAAAGVTQRMKDDIAKLVKNVVQSETRLTYYYELDPTYYSVTSKTFVGSLFSQIGLQNIADAADRTGKAGGYPQLSAEVIVKANPDMIFLADSKCCKQSAATIKARPGWAKIAAVTKNQVISLNDDVASRWGPRVVDLVRAIVDAVVKAHT